MSTDPIAVRLDMTAAEADFVTSLIGKCTPELIEELGFTPLGAFFMFHELTRAGCQSHNCGLFTISKDKTND